jgi:hypothetical protein
MSLKETVRTKVSRYLYSGVDEFKKGYDPRSNLVNVENGDLLADSHDILNRWKYYVSHLLNIHRLNDIWQTEMRTAVPLVLQPSPFEVEIATENLERCKSPDIYQIPTELVQAGGKKLCSEIHLLILFRKRKNCHSSGRYYNCMYL